MLSIFGGKSTGLSAEVSFPEYAGADSILADVDYRDRIETLEQDKQDLEARVAELALENDLLKWAISQRV